ncbi:anosmin-1, partial [Paramuricea clavata]
VKAVVADHDVTSSSVLARWKASNITNAVYIIQIREIDSRSIHYTDANWLDWKQLQQGVAVTGIKVNGLPSGVRLQLRVAIVNSTGLQSIGPPTRVIRTLFNASNPSGPEQIWVMKKTYNKNLVNVTLVWSPPVILDVPVHTYRIYWKQIPLITADLAVLTKKRTRVAGTQYNYTIQNLKPDTTYNIEIEVICLWQKKRLKSPKVALNISTGHIKDNGKGSIDVYFIKNKTKKGKSDNRSPSYDESIEHLHVLVERQITTTTTPRQAQNKSVFNSARRRRPNLWMTLSLMWLTFSLFAFQTN